MYKPLNIIYVLLHFIYIFSLRYLDFLMNDFITQPFTIFTCGEVHVKHAAGPYIS